MKAHRARALGLPGSMSWSWMDPRRQRERPLEAKRSSRPKQPPHHKRNHPKRRAP
jgi:hypothetical protein